MVIFIFIFSGKWEGNKYHLGVKDEAFTFISACFSSSYRLDHCKGGSMETINNPFLSKSQLLLLLDDI